MLLLSRKLVAWYVSDWNVVGDVIPTKSVFHNQARTLKNVKGLRLILKLIIVFRWSTYQLTMIGSRCCWFAWREIHLIILINYYRHRNDYVVLASWHIYNKQKWNGFLFIYNLERLYNWSEFYFKYVLQGLHMITNISVYN